VAAFCLFGDVIGFFWATVRRVHSALQNVIVVSGSPLKLVLAKREDLQVSDPPSVYSKLKVVELKAQLRARGLIA
jgi:hypothetical protein